MRRLVSASVAVLFLGLAPLTGVAASIVPRPVITANPSITFVQGWWELEHREQRARQGYWRLPPPEIDQYHRLQQEINQLRQQRREIDERISRAEYEQHQMLGFKAR
jgi:hypothetical protein